MATPCCRKINTPISGEVKSNNSHYARRFSSIRLLFFVCHIFSVCRGESSFWHLISWIFVTLFRGGSGSAYAKVHWGEHKRETQRGRDQSLSHKLQSVSQPSAITRRRRRLARHKRMASKCSHYGTCHQYFSR